MLQQFESAFRPIVEAQTMSCWLWCQRSWERLTLLEAKSCFPDCCLCLGLVCFFSRMQQIEEVTRRVVMRSTRRAGSVESWDLWDFSLTFLAVFTTAVLLSCLEKVRKAIFDEQLLCNSISETHLCTHCSFQQPFMKYFNQIPAFLMSLLLWVNEDRAATWADGEHWSACWQVVYSLLSELAFSHKHQETNSTCAHSHTYEHTL